MADTNPTPSIESVPPAFDPSLPVTFIFLADPQQDRDDDGNYRKINCSDLNVALNTLDSSNWPTNFKISCAGQPIGKINAVFFAGDMCQNGGDRSAKDQRERRPPTYDGGSELIKSRSLYQTGFDAKLSDVDLLKYDPKYFGLGNHDFQSDYTTAIGWYKGRWSLDFSLPENYWRYQMWNFISQMHTGYRQPLLPYSNPVYPIDWQNIDTDYGKGTFDYENYSLNYVINLGPVDIYQLHRYGGDNNNGRQDGIGWLEGKLAARGTTRPIIIVQHYLFSQTIENGGVTPSWTDAQRNRLLTILSPYNIIAFFVGHDHTTGPLPNSVPVPTLHPTRNVPEFRPGCAFNQNFALARVTPSTMDVLYGTVAEQQVVWTDGANFPVPIPNQ
ncbi:Metallo-dependent phosphatase, partial [Artomyces pyxidatus]